MNIIRNLPNFEPKIVPQPDLKLRSTNPLHLAENGQMQGNIEAGKADLGTFGNMMVSALGQTSNQILDSQLLQQQSIVSPDSVDPSTLVVSMLKADMGLSLTKAVIDRAIASYKELTTVR